MSKYREIVENILLEETSEINLNIQDLPGEEWKFIPDYEDKYAINNMGRVKSVERDVDLIIHGTLCTRHIKEKILKPCINYKSNYSMPIVTIGLSPNDSSRRTQTYYIPVLVAQAFMPDYDKDKKIVHLDGNYLNNRIDNLKQFTRSEIRASKINAGKLQGSEYKKVKCIETGQIFEKMSDAAKWIGVGTGTMSYYLNKVERPRIRKVIRKDGSLYTHPYIEKQPETLKGYHFEFVD